MVLISYNHDSVITSVVSARSLELALAYWQGKGVDVYTHQCLETDFTSLLEHPTGVIEFVKTKNVSDYDMRKWTEKPSGNEFVLISKI